MTGRGLKLFLDFDGTITRQDVGNAFFRTFGGKVCDELVSSYRAGAISATACFRKEAEATGRLTQAAVDVFLAGQSLDPGLGSVVRLCRERGIPFWVVSDGLDCYIRPLLEREGFGDIPFFSNRAFLEGGPGGANLRVEFPFTNAECDRCACCKRNHMLTLAGEKDVIVYVGDGFSDRCPVEYADVVFARGELQAWCQFRNISFYEYTSLEDVARRLESLGGRSRIRVRRRAELKRREAFVGES
jgi:2,3-diketo-5-methylthio-1-phosphopentane phosphatase